MVHVNPTPWRGDFVKIAIRSGNEASNGGLESVNICLNLSPLLPGHNWCGQPDDPELGPPPEKQIILCSRVGLRVVKGAELLSALQHNGGPLG